MKNLLEIACFNTTSCLIAQGAGADRIEFCKSYENGGITPDKKDIVSVRKQLTIPLHVIIRPRGGNFIYSANELQEMHDAIHFCRANKVNGIVFGILNRQNEINEEAVSELKNRAGEMKCTFHRAIDECRDLSTSIEKLVRLGIHSVLSSGGDRSALKGKTKLSELAACYSDKIELIAGGNVRSTQFPELFQTKCTSFHSSAMLDDSGICNENEIIQLKKILQTNPS